MESRSWNQWKEIAESPVKELYPTELFSQTIESSYALKQYNAWVIVCILSPMATVL